MRHHTSPSNAATLLWIDPGPTTGLCLVSIDSAWLTGVGSPGFSGMAQHLTSTWHAQIGRVPLIWKGGRAQLPKGHDIPMMGRRYSEVGGLDSILAGEGKAGGNVKPLVPLWVVNEVETVATVQSLLNAWPLAAWGIEDFEVRKIVTSRDFLAPPRLIGALAASELIHGQRGRVPFIASPAERHQVSEERLRQAGLFRPGMVHANDAAQHVALFLRKARQSLDLRAAAWPHLFGGVSESDDEYGE